MEKKISDHIFEPVETKQAYKEVSEKIKTAIFNGTLKPEDRLPSEIALAKQFQVSRQTVREALRLLEMSGFITIRRGSAGGPIIEKTVLHAVSNALLNALQMQNVTLNDITVARIETEKSVLRYAIKNADQADINALSENISTAKRKVEQGITVFPDNVEFHILLARASKNPVFIVVVESILALGAEYISRFGLNFEASKKTLAEHEKILKAVIERNTEEAIRLIKDHLLRIGHRNKSTTE
ncbi:GntR family transcriptional regulator [Desulfobacula sp.]|uniref:FadR/GntR family transcriptional regulator n=1 Tax=Desulfobacula sp. TaxID=2593537 RepID=UPI0026161256|nr:GntR family transcriptional regulator [Desulfobacula sp.]